MIVNAPRLGSVSSDQLQVAFDRFQLGRIESVTPASTGMGGQNLFVRTATGEYVFRGNPLFPGQFAKERYVATVLHDRTTLPFPHPYFYDPIPDVFGWDYAIMPRLRGHALSDPEIRPSLTRADFVAITHRLSDTLATIHRVHMPHAGDYDPASDSIVALDGPMSGREAGIVRTLMVWAREKTGQIEDADDRWIDGVLARCARAVDTPFQPVVVLHDYQVGNMLFDRRAGSWIVTGVFDLAEAYVGDGESDLARTVTGLLRGAEVELARTFVEGYVQRRPTRPGLLDRLTTYSLAFLVIEWGLDAHLQQTALRTFVADRLSRLKPVVDSI